MASFPLPSTFTTAPTTTTKTLPNSFVSNSIRRLPKTSSKQTHRYKVSCNATQDDNQTQRPKLILPKTSLELSQNVDRRNVLLGLGGLYGTASLTSMPSAFAAPIVTPDISTCIDANEGIANIDQAVRGVACCPPEKQKTVKEFVFPKDEPLRLRQPAHKISAEYIEKYKSALKAMRALPDDHPHSFVAQARIHCAYCNGGYSQVASGFPDMDLQIHNSWLFFPFHRWYLYFYERILGKLIGDPTFALPFWNWDTPTGMMLPPFLDGEGTPEDPNPAYDKLRNTNHLPPTVVNLNYFGRESNLACIDQINDNLTLMYKQMVTNAADTISFFGGEYKAGPIEKPSVGSVEAGCHTAIHIWTGSNDKSIAPNGEDMSNFYSAGYDPAFYLHHSNVDRMWKIWKDLKIQGHTEPTDEDWLNTSYVFYDENEELVRVYNKDSVNIEKLNYGYEYAPLPWLNTKPSARNKGANVAKKVAPTVQKVQDVKFPLKLDKIMKVLVKRPVKGRSRKDKEKSNEVLIIKDINFDAQRFVKFDVFVNDQDDTSASSPADSEFAGSFAQLAHNSGKKMFMKSAARFGLNELLDDIDAEDDESILVTLVPRVGCEELTIGDIKIEFVNFF